MSDYIKLTSDGPEIYSIGQLRRDNLDNNVSLPRPVTSEVLASYGVYPYTTADQPGYDPVIQVVEPGDFAETESGWVRGWTVRDKLPEEYPIQTAEDARKEDCSRSRS